MGQPIIPTNAAAYQQQYNLAAMQQQQQNLMRAQQLGGQLILSPRLPPTPGAPGAAGVQTSQHQALMGMPPAMVSSTDAASAGSVLYSAATLQNPALVPTAAGQTTADLGQYGLMNQTLLDYPGAVDPSAAGMSSSLSTHKQVLESTTTRPTSCCVRQSVPLLSHVRG